jgi:hypothetical protein
VYGAFLATGPTFAGFAAQMIATIQHWRTTLVNETVDQWVEQWPEPKLTMQWGESVQDLLLTLALPTKLMIVARRWPKLLVHS